MMEDIAPVELYVRARHIVDGKHSYDFNYTLPETQ
jgi:hypothetical protein